MVSRSFFISTKQNMATKVKSQILLRNNMNKTSIRPDEQVQKSFKRSLFAACVYISKFNLFRSFFNESMKRVIYFHVSIFIYFCN